MSLFDKFISECENGFIEQDTLNKIIEQNQYCNIIWNFGLRFVCQFGHLNLVEFMIANGADNFIEGIYCSFDYVRRPNLQRFNECKIADFLLNYSTEELSVEPQYYIEYKKYKNEQLLITKLHTDLILYIVSKYCWK